MGHDTAFLLERIGPGHGRALDLGGKAGTLRQAINSLGYCYTNIDLRLTSAKEPTVIGDAHCLPLRDSSFALVVSQDSLEHFARPWVAVDEVRRVLKPGGRFVVWVPWMHPFHGDDYYRYSPLGLKYLLRGFEISSIESPWRLLTLCGLIVCEALKRLGLGWAGRLFLQACRRLDGAFERQRSRPAAMAAAYCIVASNAK